MINVFKFIEKTPPHIYVLKSLSSIQFQRGVFLVESLRTVPFYQSKLTSLLILPLKTKKLVES